MFSNELFRSWLFILLGGACFALIFGGIVMMSEVLFFEATHVSSAVKGIAGLSFLGYIGLAWLLRTSEGDL
jgi:hypothetical protein